MAGITGTSCIDATPADSLYYYAVTARDAAGNESPLSSCVSVNSDRQAPPAPANLQLSASGNGVLVTWDRAGDQSAFGLYRSEKPIVLRDSLAPIVKLDTTGFIDHPSFEGMVYYAVTAFDAAGNESQVSLCDSIAWDITGPSAVVILSQGAHVKSGVAPIDLHTSEAVSGTPRLSVTPASGQPIAVTLSGVNRDWRGTFTVDGTMTDGTALFRFTATDRAGNTGSAITSGETFVIDNTPPREPAELTAAAQPLGQIKLRWQPPVNEPAMAYNIYRDTLDIDPQSLSSLPVHVPGCLNRSYTETPPQDRAYYYAVQAIDLAGNAATGGNFRKASVFADRVPPASIGVLMAGVAQNGVVNLNWNRIADSGVTYRLYRNQQYIQSITGLTPLAVGIPDTIARDIPPVTGEYYYAVTACDQAGNESGVSPCCGVYSDVIPPSVRIAIAPASPVRSGAVRVTLQSSEPLDTMPALRFRPAGGRITPIALSPAGQGWSGEFAVTDSMADGAAWFYFTGRDSAGNIGQNIASGATFVIDHTPPPPVTSLRAVSEPQGAIALSYEYNDLTAGPALARIYMAIVPITSTVGLSPVHEAPFKYSYQYRPPQDGRYYFALTLADLAGNESRVFNSVPAVSDRVPPLVPDCLAACDNGSGLLLTWRPKEAGLRYELYRDIKRLSDAINPNTRIAADLVDTSFLDVPPIPGAYYYCLRAYDEAGNAGAAIRADSVHLVTALPTAAISINPQPPLRTDAVVSVAVAESLPVPPRLSCRSGGSVTPITMTGRGRYWNGTINIAQIGEGRNQFLYTGTDGAGRTTNMITAGEYFIKDVTPANTQATIIPGSPVTSGKVRVELRPNEPLDTSGLSLAFTPMGGVGQRVALHDSAGILTGSFTIARSTHDGTAFFSFWSKDKAGNISTALGGDWQFQIDNTPPEPPIGLAARPRIGGAINLTWTPAGGDRIASYDVYRSAAPIIDTAGLTPIVSGAAGLTITDRPAGDGYYYYAVTAANLCGLKSRVSDAAPAVSDRVAPGAPRSLATVTRPGRVRLAWEPPFGETPWSYQVYKLTGGSREMLAAVADSNRFEHQPVLDGNYTYLVTALDSLGNESVPATDTVNFVQSLPVAAITLSRRSPVNGGTDTVFLAASKDLIESKLWFKPERMDPVPIPLTGSGRNWQGTFTVTEQTGDGKARFLFTGRAANGDTGTGIASGDTFTIDTHGPEAYISISPKSPVKAGPVILTLTAKEPLRQAPALVYIPSGSNDAIAITLSGSGCTWQGQFEVPHTVGQGAAFFQYQGVDLAGVMTSVVAEGKAFYIDTEAPAIPAWIKTKNKLAAEPVWPNYSAGIEVKWQVPRGALGQWYRIFRSNQPFTSVSGLYPVKEINCLGQYNPFDNYYKIIDNPAMDGIYYYAVIAIDSAGNQSGFIQSAGMRCDRVPPAAPANLTVAQIPNGSLKFTWQKPAGEPPFCYNVYCSENPLVSPAGASLIGQNIPWTEVYGCPNHDGHYYFGVTALDTAGNESQISPMAEYDYVNYPPVARIKLSPTNWLRTGRYSVSLSASEELDSCLLTYTPLDKPPVPVQLHGQGMTWTGAIDIDDTTGDGAAYFLWQGHSITGQRGQIIMEGEYFVIDHAAPAVVESLRVTPSGNSGGLEVTWKTPRGETPRYYKLYRSEQPITDTAGLFPVWRYRCDTIGTYMRRLDIPPVDGQHYYAMACADLAGNWSPLTASVMGTSIRELPTATIKLYTGYTGERWTDRVGKGQVRITLQPSRQLAPTPQLAFTMNGTDSTVVSLADSGGLWIGRFTVTDSTPCGTGRFSFHGRDTLGRVGDEIVFGREFLVNTTAPVAEVIIPEIYRMRPDVFRNRLVTRPLKAGTWPLKLSTNAPLFDRPNLCFAPLDGLDSTSIPMDGFEKEWMGSLVIGPNTGDTTYEFGWRGQDREGNWGDFVDSVRYDYDFIDIEDLWTGIIHRNITNTYASTGGKFTVDTRPPEVPKNVATEARQGGVAVVTWEHPNGELPGGYDLYRDVYPITESSLVRLQPMKRDIMATIAVDDPPVDGTYYYAVKAVDLAGNVGPVSSSPSIFIDSWKPEIKYTAVPSGDYITLRMEATEPLLEFNCMLSFPGVFISGGPALGGESGAMFRPTVIQRSPTTWDIIIEPQQIEYFNGQVEVHVSSPDLSGNVTRSRAGIAVEPVNPTQGGEVSSSDGDFKFEIPAGYVPFIPNGPEVPDALNRSHLFFIVAERTEGVDDRVPRESEPAQTIDLSRVHPGLKLVGTPYTITLGSEPGQPEFCMDRSSSFPSLPEMPRITFRVPQIRDQYNDTSYMRRKIMPYQWRPERIDTSTGEVAPGKWIVLKDCVHFADSSVIVAPATAITKYALFAELKAPRIMSCTPDESTVLHDYQPELRIEVQDFGTGIDPSSIKLKIDGTTVQHQYLVIDPWKGVITYRPPQPLTGNTHTAELRVEDVVENACVHRWNFYIDNLPPQIAGSIPQDSSVIRQVRPVISCQVSDIGGGLDTNRVSLSFDSARVPSGFDRQSGRLTYLPPTLAQGWHRASVEAFDNIGMKAVKTWSFAVDTAGPWISGMTPAGSSFVNRDSITISARVIDAYAGVDPDSLRLLVDGAARPVCYHDSTAASTTVLSEGWHQARIFALDRIGNRSERIWQFCVDLNPPVITRVGAADTCPPPRVDRPLIRFCLRDSLSGIDSASLAVTVDDCPVSAVSFNPESGQAVAVLDSQLSPGLHAVSVSAADRAGNRSALQWEITPGTVSAHLADLEPAAGSLINRDRPPIGAAIIGISADSAVARLDGVPVPMTFDSLTQRFSYQPDTGLGQGRHRVTVALIGGLEEGWSFTIDSRPPQIHGCLPLGTVSVASPAIALQCRDAGTGLSLPTANAALDGRIIPARYDSAYGRFLFDISGSLPLACGRHTAEFSIGDRTGNRAQTQWQFTVDTTQAGITNIRPAPNSVVASLRPVISCAISPPRRAVPDTSIWFSLDWQPVPFVIDSTGTVTASLSEPLPEGRHLAVATASDSSGRSASASWTFFCDATPPEIAEPQPSGVITARRPLISCRMHDAGIGLDTLTFHLGLDDLAVPARYDRGSGTVWFKSLADFAPGAHTVTATVRDCAGNASQSQWSFVIDSGAPEIAAVGPDHGSYVADARAAVWARFAPSAAGFDPDSVALYLDGERVTAVYDTVCFMLTHVPTTGLSEGMHQAMACGAGRNGAAARRSWSFGVDATRPAISEARPRSGSSLTTMSPLLAARINERHPAGAPVIELDGIARNAVWDSAAGVIWYRCLSPLPEGRHSYRFKVQDLAGNTDSCGGWFDLVPSGGIFRNFEPADGAYANDAGTIRIRLHPAPGELVTDSLALYVDDGMVRFQLQADDSGSLLQYAPASPLDECSHLVTCQALTANGQKQDIDFMFRIDRTPPAIEQVRPKNGSYQSGQRMFLSAFLRDLAAGLNESTIRLELDSLVRPCSFTADPGWLSCQVDDLPAGEHQFAITVSDRAGNVASQQGQFWSTGRNGRWDSLSPAPGTAVIVSRPALAARLERSDNPGIDSLFLWLDGQAQTPEFDPVTGRLGCQPDRDLADGRHEAFIAAIDSAGQEISTRWEFSVAQTPPRIISVIPGSGIVVAADRPVIWAAVDDPGGNIDGQSVRVTLDGAPIAASYHAATGCLLAPAPAALSDGQHGAVVIVSDRSGRAACATTNFTVDAAKPVVTGLSPAAGAIIREARPVISATVSDAAIRLNPQNLSLSLDGQAVSFGYDPATGELIYQPAQPLADGAHLAVVSAADTLRRTVAQGWSFITDVQSPVLSELSPAHQCTVTVSRPLISARATDPCSGVDPNAIVMRLDSLPVAAAYQPATGVVQCLPAAALAEGRHNVSLSIADSAGNVRQVNWRFDVAPMIQRRKQATFVSAGSRGLVWLNYKWHGSGSDSLHLLGPDAEARLRAALARFGSIDWSIVKSSEAFAAGLDTNGSVCLALGDFEKLNSRIYDSLAVKVSRGMRLVTTGWPFTGSQTQLTGMKYNGNLPHRNYQVKMNAGTAADTAFVCNTKGRMIRTVPKSGSQATVLGYVRNTALPAVTGNHYGLGDVISFNFDLCKVSDVNSTEAFDRMLRVGTGRDFGKGGKLAGAQADIKIELASTIDTLLTAITELVDPSARIISADGTVSGSTINWAPRLIPGAVTTLEYRVQIPDTAAGSRIFTTNINYLAEDHVYRFYRSVPLTIDMPRASPTRKPPLPALLPLTYGLDQCHPNPASGRTSISYQLPEAARIKLTVYNVMGQVVSVLVDERQPAGYYKVAWDGRNDQKRKAAAGTYLYRLEAAGKDTFRKIRKLVWIR
ncbi:MAG: FlgD immunoglobulin-like domain containing protein [Candidatus Edwardsbacteria bacterium]|nr:FlgD immunoglobulin-like domain containing protein [Candidatus Edwardsbacteria bacterium]